MPATVELEYPLPGDTVAADFHAGGDYDATQAYDEARKAAKAAGLAFLDDATLPTGSYVQCDWTDANGNLLDSQQDDLDGEALTGTWDVELSTTSTADLTGCQLTASIVVGGVTSTVTDSTTDLTVTIGLLSGAIDVTIC